MSDRPHRIAEAAAQLGVSESWLAKAVTARKVPHHRLGRVVVFYADDIAEIMAMHKVVPHAVPGVPALQEYARRNTRRAQRGRAA
jgi:excisionase family DNA binding protein